MRSCRSPDSDEPDHRSEAGDTLVAYCLSDHDDSHLRYELDPNELGRVLLDADKLVNDFHEICQTFLFPITCAAEESERVATEFGDEFEKFSQTITHLAQRGSFASILVMMRVANCFAQGLAGIKKKWPQKLKDAAKQELAIPILRSNLGFGCDDGLIGGIELGVALSPGAYSRVAKRTQFGSVVAHLFERVNEYRRLTRRNLQLPRDAGVPLSDKQIRTLRGAAVDRGVLAICATLLPDLTVKSENEWTALLVAILYYIENQADREQLESLYRFVNLEVTLWIGELKHLRLPPSRRYGHWSRKVKPAIRKELLKFVVARSPS